MGVLSPSFAKSILTAHGGPARYNKYRVIMPTLFIGGDSLTLDTLCRTATLPSRAIDTTKRKVNMKIIQVPSGYTNGTVDFTFTETSDGMVSRYLDEWMGRIVSEKTYDIAYKVDVVRDIIIMRTDNDGLPTYTCILRNAFPKLKSQIDMSDTNNNTAIELRATFEYDDFHIIDNPLVDGLSDIKRTLKSGKFKIPTNLIANLSRNIF